MLVLWLIAAHLTGDFVLQTRWQAALKFSDWRERFVHCSTYMLCFVPVMVGYEQGNPAGGSAFLVALLILHFATDSHRFRSTLGDCVSWYLDYRKAPEALMVERVEELVEREGLASPTVETVERLRMRPPRIDPRWPSPNPWQPTGLMIDQTLHVIQIAALATLFLR